MNSDDQNKGSSPQPNDDWARHWDIVCLGIVTVGTAALGGAVLSSDLKEIVSSWPKYCLAILVLTVYVTLLFSARHAIFSDASTSDRPEPGWKGRVQALYACTGSKKRRAEMVFAWFIGELLALVALFGILEAIGGFLATICKSC